MKTLKLLYPEWQGYGEDNRAAQGAFAVFSAFAQKDQFVAIDVPMEESLRVEGGILGRSSIAKSSRQVLDNLNTAGPDRIFMIGGTCGSEMVTVGYLNQRYQSDLAVLWLDAHPDLNTPQSSPSGHFHGMVLRALLGDGDPVLSEFVPRPLSPSQVTLAGVRESDKPEAEFVSAERIAIISPDDLNNPNALAAAVERHGASHLYVHLDVDFFNPDTFRGAQFQAPGGISLDRLAPILADLNQQYTTVGLSVVEFASDDPDLAATIPALLEKSGITWACT